MEMEIELYCWSTFVITLSCNLLDDWLCPVERTWVFVVIFEIDVVRWKIRSPAGWYSWFFDPSFEENLEGDSLSLLKSLNSASN